MNKHGEPEPCSLHVAGTGDDHKVVANDNHFFQRVCDIAARCDCCWFAWVGVVDKTRDRIVPVASAGYDDHYLDDIRVDVSATAYGRGPIGSAARQDCIWIIEDVESDGRMAPWRDEALRRGYRSVAAFPLRSSTGIVAVLAVYTAASFTADALERFVRLTNEVSLALSACTMRASA
jgi:GAF domain-containing protein